MDAKKWNSLLLNWIHHTNLIPIGGDGDDAPKPVRIEDTDIRTFFSGLKELLKITDISPRTISDFLRVNYPAFELSSTPAQDDPFRPSSDVDSDLPPLRDYPLVYSIFLHYGCIACLDKAVQRTSQSLSAGEQLAVTVFLNHFLYRNVIVTRPALTLAIREAVHSMDAGPLAKFYAEDENGNRAEGYTTPKTQKLEQNCREIYRLRGQVDTVGFEMSYLEGLVRERDIQIANMKQREGDLQKEIEELKKTILYGVNSEAYPTDDQQRMAVELMRKEKAVELRQLRKSNALLEDKVANLLVEVDHKDKLVTKLKMGSKELKAYKERETELANHIAELQVELAGKTRQIGELLEVNLDLESYIAENKSQWGGCGKNGMDLSMNTSSMSAYSFNGGGGGGAVVSSSSPNASSSSLLRSANLGSCVIDIQLKEKELENGELKGQLSELEEMVKGWRVGIGEFLEENGSIKESCAITTSTNGQFPIKIPEFFKAISETLREKTQLETTVQSQVTVILRFREERDRLSEQLAAQVEQCKAMERELNELRELVKSYAETERRELDTVRYEVKHLNDLMTVQKLEKESFRSAIEKGEEDVYAKIRRIAKLNLVIEKLRFEKKRAESEQKEAEVNLNRRWELKVEEWRVRCGEVERRLAEAESVAGMRQKQVALVEQTRDQLAERCEEVKRAKEEGERRAVEREEMGRREVSRMKDVVEKLEREVGELRRDKANLETKLRIVGGLGLRPSVSLDVGKMMGKPDDDKKEEEEAKARRSSLRNQLTSTPRLSMKQKVRLDMELMKRRRISLLSPDDEDVVGQVGIGGLKGVNSELSESDDDENIAVKKNGCHCQKQKQPKLQLPPQISMSASTKPAVRLRVGRRDSLIFNSPAKKRKPSSLTRSSNVASSKAAFDRTAINKLQKQKRQKIFNTAREIVRESEPTSVGGGCGSPLDSLLWDGAYDLMDLEGGEDFGVITNNEQMQKNFQDILQAERCDGEDLFEGGQVTPPNPLKGLVLRKILLEEEGEGEGEEEEEALGNDIRTEVSIERRAVEEGEELMTTPSILRNSLDRSAASTIQSKSYSMNSGVYWGNERIPTASVVHFSPRRATTSTLSPQRERLRRMIRNWDLNLIPLSTQNLLQLIAIVLIGILLGIVYQSMVY